MNPLLLYLRSLLFYLFLFAITIFYGTLLGTIGWFLRLSLRHRLARSWARLGLAGLRLLCGLDYRVQGLEQLATLPNAVVLVKHQSAWETLALRLLLPLHHTPILKRELLWLPFFGWALAACRPIAINRGTPKQALKQVLREGGERIARGEWLLLFPEGTRVAPGQRHRYGASGAMIAKRSGVAVVPVVHNAGVFWGRNAFIKYPGTIDLRFGPPMATSEHSAQQITDAVEAWIEGELAALPQQAGKPRAEP